MTRRLYGLAAAVTLTLMACSSGPPASASEPSAASARVVSPTQVQLPDSEWRTLLSSEEFDVMRRAGTERAFSGELLNNHDDGVYVCGSCGLVLFDSQTKFESGTGWPSYYQPIADGRVVDKVDSAYGMSRTENLCARCGAHLGHVFPDGPRPTGLRYCINSAALDFVPRSAVASLGEPAAVALGGYSSKTTPNTD